MSSPRWLLVIVVVIGLSLAIGLAAELWDLLDPEREGNLVVVLLAGMALVFLAVFLTVRRPTVAAATGAGLGGIAVAAMVLGLLLPFLMEAGDRALAEYASDEEWHTLVFVQLIFGVPAGCFAGAFIGLLGWLAHEAISPSGG